jgi:hypothetical protein
MPFSRYFPPKNHSIEGLFNDFLKKTIEKNQVSEINFISKSDLIS